MSGDMREGLIASFESAVAATENVVEQAAELGRAVQGLREARDEFFATGQVLLNDRADRPLAEWFPTAQGYLRFLARIGRSPDQDVREEYETTEKTVEVLEALHTPGTIVYLKTDIRGNRLAKPAVAIGRVVGTPRPQIMAHRAWGDERSLVLTVQTAVTKGDPRKSEVGIDDIALGFDRSVIPDALSPLIAVGAVAVKPLVEQAYSQPTDPTEDDQDAFTALTLSGLRLAELGFPKEKIAATRRVVEDNLRLVARDLLNYHHEAIMLPALCRTTREALRIVGTVLGGRKADGVSNELERDYRLLLDNLGP